MPRTSRGRPKGVKPLPKSYEGVNPNSPEYVPVQIPPGRKIIWTIEQAAIEFDVQPAYLQGLLNKIHEPHNKNRYATVQIVNVLTSGLNREKQRDIYESANNRQLRNEMLRSTLIEKKPLMEALASLIVGLRQVIMASTMPDRDKRDACRNIDSLPLALEQVAERQSSGLSKKKEPGDNGNGDSHS